jgi:exosortase/archaeosortase family protein
MARLSGLMLAPLAAYWSVWADYAGRLRNDHESIVHLVAVAVGLLVLWDEDTSPRARATRRGGFVLSLACLIAFALAYAHVAAMARCALALLGVGSFVCWQRGSSRPVLGLAFMLLGIPMLAQLESLAGVSLRVTVAEAAAALVRMPGLPIEADGTRLVWAGGAVDVDAPCSGLRMLWTGALASLVAIARFRLRASAALSLAAGALLLIWSGNVLRCAALFYVESGMVTAPAWAHGGIGLIVFCGVCASLWEGARWLSRPRPVCTS